MAREPSGTLVERIVRTARAVVRHALDRQPRPGERGFLGLDEGKPRLDAVGSVKARNAAGNRTRNHRRSELAGRRQQPFAMPHPGPRFSRGGPLAILVELADDARTHRFLPVVEFFLQLILEELTLLLDDQNLLQPIGELPHAFGLERPHHADLVHTQADRRSGGRINAEVIERLAHVEIALAAGDEAEAGIGAIDHCAVQLVDAAIGERGVQLVVQQALFLHQRRIGPAQVEPISRQRKILLRRDHGIHPERIDLHRGGRLHRIGQRLERHPAA